MRATTGLVLDSYFSATKMKWFLESGRARTATSPEPRTIDTWLLWWLSGGERRRRLPDRTLQRVSHDADGPRHARLVDGDDRALRRAPAMLADIRPSTTNFAA